MKKAKSFLSWKIWRALNRKMSVMTSLFAVLACAFAMMASDPASAQNQVPAKKNLIFIIDDSGSMVPHQNQLAKSATPILVDAFRSGILASVTVITTTSKADAGQNFKISRVIPQNLNLEADLNDALTPGSGGSTIERPTDSLYEHLKDGSIQLSASPDEMTIFVLFTNAEDQSQVDPIDVLASLLFQSGYGVRMDGAVPSVESAPRAYARHLLGQESFRIERKISFVGILIGSSETDSVGPGCQRDDDAKPVRIEALSAALAGSYINLCSSKLDLEIKAQLVKQLNL